MILWDLVGSCNLRCPSCPMGSMRSANARGLITDELFDAILAKLTREFRCRQLHFYNWTEPLLHPRIVEHCRAAANAGFHVHLSSNLNYLKQPDALIHCGIKTIRISLSGFTQATYRIGHCGGDVETVKANMQRLALARREAGASSRTRVHVYFHKYRHNLHEVDAMKAFATSLGFDFMDDWAFLMPLEKILAYSEGTLTPDERVFADRAFLPRVDLALEAVRAAGGCAKPCTLIEQLVLDHRGRATLCCASFDHASNVIGDFLQLDWSQLQQARYAHSMCERCTAVGAHAYCTSVADPELRDRLSAMATDAAIDSAEGDRASFALPILGQNEFHMAESA